MAVQVIMPKLGLTMEEGTIVQWNFADGDTVKAGDLLYQVETDKLTNDVVSDADGILHIKFPAGAVVPATEVVGAVAAPGENVSFEGGQTAPAQAAPAQEACAAKAEQPAAAHGATGGAKVWATPKAKRLAAEQGIDLATLSGTGPQGMIAVKDLDGAAGVKASPMAAKVAADLGVDLAAIQKDGRIMRGDVVAAANAASSAATLEAASRRVPMNAMRKAISRNMSASWSIAPMVNYNLRADVTALGELKNTLSSAGTKISYTDILVKIAAVALKEFPLLNSSIDGDAIVLHDTVNIGVAVALDNGLIVPVVKGVESKGIAAISTKVKELAEKARLGQLAADEFSGGTFTVSNLGMFGMESFTPIINQPECAILGVNAIVKTAVEMDGEIVMRPLMNLSLTADHRAVDGAEAAKFMARLRELISDPWKLLL